MPFSTNLPTAILNEHSHISSPRNSQVVTSSVDASFFSPEGILTLAEIKMPSETNTGNRRHISVPRVFQPSTAATERFTLLQKWDGVVLEADAESFSARLLDGQGELPPQQAVFSRSELSPEEEPQITPGATFVWTIGYRHKPSRERVSCLYFRRLPPWSAEEIDTARGRGQELSTAIGWK